MPQKHDGLETQRYLPVILYVPPPNYFTILFNMHFIFVVCQLKAWVKSKRDRFAKLLSQMQEGKSGAGADDPDLPRNKEWTDRDKWIWDSFQFLEVHIVRKPSRSSSQVNMNIIF